MSDDDRTPGQPSPTVRGSEGRALRPPLDVGAVARDDALLDAIGGRHPLRTPGLGLSSQTDADADDVIPGRGAVTGPGIDGRTNPAADDPVVGLLQAFVADLDDQLVASHPSLEHDDRGLRLRVVPDMSSHPALPAMSVITPAVAPVAASLARDEQDELAVLSGPGARLQTAARVLTAARGTRVVREKPANPHRRPLGHRTAVSSAAAMAIAFTVSLSGVAAAVTGNPMAPYREVLQAVRMAPSDAQVSAEQGVEIGRDLGAANAALQRGDTESANKFIDEAEASIEEHIEDNEGDEDSFVAELQDEVVELRQDAEAVAAAASQDPVIAGGDEGAEEALPVPGDSSDDPGASAPPSGETAAEDGLGSADPGSEASATADTAISGPTPGSATASSDVSPSGEPTSSNSPSPSPSSTTKSPTSPPSGSNSPTTMPSGSTSPTAAGTTKSSTSKPSSPTSSTSPPTTSGSPSGTSETASASTPREMI